MANKILQPLITGIENISGWIGIIIIRAMGHLPLGWLQRIGKCVGTLAYYVFPYRQRIALINIHLCFPELSLSECKALLRRHYQSMGIGIFELAAAWYQDPQRLAKYADIEGIEHVHAVQASGRGALMLTAHFTTLEIGGRFLNDIFQFSCLYRKPNHPVIAKEMTRVRENAMRRVIHRDEMQDLVRALREGEFIWYAPDQGQKIKYSSVLPFFGVPANTNTATTRIAKMGRAAIIPFFAYRLPNNRYKVEILPERTDLPSGDPEADALVINGIIEAMIRKAPEQYFWLHRKFKQRGSDLPDVYAADFPLPK